MAGKAEVTEKTIIIVPAGQSSARYEIPGFKQIFVNDGDILVPGQRLTNGSINLHDLIRLQGVEPTQRYIMNEILKIFVGQGQNIADKHLEIIVRQMFSRVQVEDASDSEFVSGDVVSKLAVVEANEQLVAEKQATRQIQPATAWYYQGVLKHRLLPECRILPGYDPRAYWGSYQWPRRQTVRPQRKRYPWSQDPSWNWLGTRRG